MSCACVVCSSVLGALAVEGPGAYRAANAAIHGRLFGRRVVFRDRPPAAGVRALAAGDVVRSTRYPELFWIEQGGGDPGPDIEHADGARVLRVRTKAQNAGAVS